MDMDYLGYKNTEQSVWYNSSFFREPIREHVKNYILNLPEEVEGLVTIGSSGCAIGTAILLMCPRIKFHRHYKKEKSHGTGPTCDIVTNGAICAIVDDFIDSGETVVDLISRARKDNVHIKHVIVSHVYDSIKRDQVISRIINTNVGLRLVYDKATYPGAEVPIESTGGGATV